MAVSPLGAGPITVEEVLDTPWPSDLYSLLDAAVPSGVSEPWTGPAAANPPPFSTPASPEGPWGLNPLVFEVVPSGGPVPESSTPGLGVEVPLLPDQGETDGPLPILTDEVLTGFFSEFPSPPNLPRTATLLLTHPPVSPGLFSTQCLEHLDYLDNLARLDRLDRLDCLDCLDCLDYLDCLYCLEELRG